jgi:hypothetical protein
MDILDIIIIVLVIFIVYKLLNYKQENFDGLSYTDKAKYQDCCKEFGCNSFNCQYFLHMRQSPYVLVGVIMKDKKDIYSLYRRYNLDRKNYEYYYLDNREKNNEVYLKLETNGSELMNGDVVKIDSDEYKVYVYNRDLQISNNYQYYNYLQTYPRYMAFDNVYTNKIIKPIVGPGGVLRSLDKSKKYLILEQVLNPQHHEYSYMVNIGGNLLPLDRNKKLHDGEKVLVPGLEEEFEYLEDPRPPVLY